MFEVDVKNVAEWNGMERRGPGLVFYVDVNYWGLEAG